MRRILGPILLAVLIIGVGAAIYFSARDQLALRRTVTVRGLIGSEKEEFFKDARVVDALRKHGLVVQIEKAGSRQIAGFNLKEYDFAFPAGVPAAEKIRREQNISQKYTPFFTPMAIASWKSIARLLEVNGVAKDQGGYYSFDMAQYLDLVAGGKRWTDLQDNTAYPASKSILISSTDVRKSNSAAMYLALSSYVRNNANVVQSEAEISQVMPLMKALFLKQGYTEYSSEGPFEDYLVMGMGKAPLVMIYEAQFLYQLSLPQSAVSDEMALLYPEPTIFTKHILIPLSDAGARLGALLQDDPELQQLAVENGFRSNNAASFRDFLRRRNLAIPDNLVNVIEPPSYEALERMIQLIEQEYP